MHRATSKNIHKHKPIMVWIILVFAVLVTNWRLEPGRRRRNRSWRVHIFVSPGHLDWSRTFVCVRVSQIAGESAAESDAHAGAVTSIIPFLTSLCGLELPENLSDAKLQILIKLTCISCDP